MQYYTFSNLTNEYKTLLVQLQSIISEITLLQYESSNVILAFHHLTINQVTCRLHNSKCVKTETLD